MQLGGAALAAAAVVGPVDVRAALVSPRALSYTTQRIPHMASLVNSWR